MKITKENLNQKGITLIALIVSIIVLLILAGVSIFMLTEDNGILQKTGEAKQKTEQAELQEIIELYISDINIEIINNPNYPDNGAIDLKDLPKEFYGAQPKLGWVYVENNFITEYEFYFDDIYILKTKNEVFVRNYTNLINVKDYGAVGNGKTDDTDAIKEAAACLNENGGILYFPIGTYIVSVNSSNESAITLDSNKNIEIDFFKSTIQMKKNQYAVYKIATAKYCTNVEFRNGNFIGDRLTHDYNTIDSEHAWGFGILSTANNTCNIINMEISNMTGDAIYTNNIYSGTTNIYDCYLHHCRRMGITIVESDIVNVKNTNIQYIGTFDGITGAAPMSGIDIEPQKENYKINHVSIDNVNIDNITYYGIVRASPKRYEDVLKVDIINSQIDNTYIKCNANIKNSRLIYPNQYTGGIEQSVIEDSYIYRNQGDLVLKDVIIDRCIIEGNDMRDGQNEISFRIVPNNVTITNSIIKNAQGNGNYESNLIAGFGIVASTGYLTKESCNNIYDGCAIIMDEFLNHNSKIKNSYIVKRKNDVTLNTIDLENCTIEINSNSLRFNSCNVTNCNISGNAEKYFKDSNLICQNIISQDYFSNGFIFDASSINVLGEVNKLAFYNVEFLNNSKIILEMYSNANLDIPKSNKETDYTIEYKGTEVIN